MARQTTVRDILKQKPSALVHCIEQDRLVIDALKLMAAHNVAALVVTNAGAIAGIFTERDYARKVALSGRSSASTRVEEVMQREVMIAAPHDGASEVLTLMAEKRARHMPVFEFGVMVGLVSMGDIVNAIIDDQGFEIGELTNYITGSVRDMSAYAPAMRWKQHGKTDAHEAG